MKVTLRRQIDEVVLCNLITVESGDWYAFYPDPTLYNIAGGSYRQHFGVMEKHIDLRMTFSDKYEDASMTNYLAMVAADRLDRKLELLDFSGEWIECKFQQKIPKPDKIDQIRHFGIFTVDVVMMQLERF